MIEPAFVFDETRWSAECFICKASYPVYHSGNRLCHHCPDRYRQHHFFREVSDLSECFVTIVPNVKDIKSEMVRQGFSDLLLAHEGTGEEPRKLLIGAFKEDLLLPCGQPALVESPNLASYAGFGSTWILDMSPYIWSGTLKDPRSWAILATAIEYDVRHLAAWTAGNAGLSLAKLVHRWNVSQPPGNRKTVYCLVDTSAPPEVVVTLRSLQARVVPISTGAGAILSRDQIFNVVSSMTELGERDYWQVTDGWDGVGIFMYGLIAQQCVHFWRQLANIPPESPTYIVLPLGTGNLLIGFYRAINQVNGKRPKLVAALPFGDNGITPFRPASKENSRPALKRVAPVAPKLTGFYSPLSPCLWHLTLNRDFGDQRSVEFIEVDRASQIEAAARVFSLDRSEAAAAEPSALIAFGALKELGQLIKNHGTDPATCHVLVLNSGFGIMGAEEEGFYTQSIFAAR